MGSKKEDEHRRITRQTDATAGEEKRKKKSDRKLKHRVVEQIIGKLGVAFRIPVEIFLNTAKGLLVVEVVVQYFAQTNH